jgi:hypothetical protein
MQEVHLNNIKNSVPVSQHVSVLKAGWLMLFTLTIIKVINTLYEQNTNYFMLKLVAHVSFLWTTIRQKVKGKNIYFLEYGSRKMLTQTNNTYQNHVLLSKLNKNIVFLIFKILISL